MAPREWPNLKERDLTNTLCGPVGQLFQFLSNIKRLNGFRKSSSGYVECRQETGVLGVNKNFSGR